VWVLLLSIHILVDNFHHPVQRLEQEKR